jgi:heptosyltransferase-2
MSETSCRHFNGYKPCSKNPVCARAACPSYESVHSRVLVIHLEALGAVLRSTSLLKAIRAKYPKAHVTWVTKAPAQALLENLIDVDRVLGLGQEDLLQLEALRFDVALVIDKSLVAAGILRRTTVDQVFGFRANSAGAIVPANTEAGELWELGLSDHKKFFVNQKSEQQLVHEALALGPYLRGEYQARLSFMEMAQVGHRRHRWSPTGREIIGINTGCSGMLPAKKLSVEGHRKLIQGILADSRFRGMPIVLLGGPTDKERNNAIARGLPVYESPLENGLRDGMVSVAACDLIFSGDSVGMHMAIALRKWTVAWFGPSCQQEVDLYGRGVKILTSAQCSPCWKRQCDKPLMCYDQVDFQEARNALARGMTEAPVTREAVLELAGGEPVLSDRISW